MENRVYRILVVDDEESILRALERVLRGPNRKVSTALDGPSALQLLAQETFDLVLSDQRMPGMNGTELLRRVKELYPFTLRVMLSGYGDFDSIVGAVNDACVARFLPKPWDNDALRAIVAELLSSRDSDLPQGIVTEFLTTLKVVRNVEWTLRGTPESLEFTVDFRSPSSSDIEDFDRSVVASLPWLSRRLAEANTAVRQVVVSLRQSGKELYHHAAHPQP